MIEGPTDKHLWAENYQREMRSILALTSEVAQAIASEIKIKVTPQEQTRLASVRPVDPKAHEAVLKGRYDVFKGTEKGARTGMGYARQAVDIDPTYAAAYILLGQSYDQLASISGLAPREAFPKAEAAYAKALEIDDTLAEAHAGLAHVKCYYDWDWTGSEREYQRALELNPNSADARGSYAAYLTVTGRFDEAIAAAKRRIELDPLTPEMRAALGRVYLFAGRYDDSIRAFKQALELDPNHLPARYWLAMGYAAKGMDAEAVAACEDVLRSLPKEGESKMPASCAQVYAVVGRRDDALRLMEQAKRAAGDRWFDPSWMAFLYSALGDKDRAMEWLEKG